MKIRRIELENIGCFERRPFDFMGDASSEGAGLTVVYGENRTGKSTLVHGLYFALFGKHLNAALSVKDLRRNGAPGGRALLHFSENGPEGLADYRLIQCVDRLPLAERRGNGNGGDWETIFANAPDTVQRLIPLSPEVAGLTSFFREGELIYFLQEIPKYNNTLLQSLIGMDEALVLKSRFKKALTKAKEYRKAVRDAAPKKPPDPLSLELARRELDRVEREFEAADREYQASKRPEERDLAVLRLLQRQYGEKRGQRDRLMELKESRPAYGDLMKQREALQNRASDIPDPKSSAEMLREQRGARRETISQAEERIDRLKRLERQPTCHVCGQTVTRERLSEIQEELQKRIDKAKREYDEIEVKLRQIAEIEEKKRVLKRDAERLDGQIKEVSALEAQVREISEQIEKLDADIRSFGLQGDELREAEADYLKAADAAKRRKALQDEIVRQRVAIEQHGDLTRRVVRNQKELAEAERRVLRCTVAHQALDEAIQGLGGRLLERIRESIGGWIGRFSFLDRFEIRMSGTELLPIIQARGYQYKLNQMSKSERIFLYLMLKLAIGDALGHLGVFILDDPADGLDEKRKETLAYLLAEVSRRRQVIVTTNDATFAGMFPAGMRLDL